MDLFKSVSDLLFGIWLPALVVAISFMAFRAYQQILDRRWELQKAERSYRLEMEKMEYERYARERRGDFAPRETADLLRAYLESSLSELATRLSSTLTQEVNLRLTSIVQALESAWGRGGGADAAALERSVQSAVEKAVQKYVNVAEYGNNATVNEHGGNSSKNNTITAETLIREIFHALNTPLSYMEVLAETKLKRMPEELSTDDFMDALESLKSSIDICKSYLAAFRQMVLVSGKSLLWSPDSIGSALRAACSVYASPGADLTFDIELPDVIRGYSNNLIVALLLPLLENAIEASPPREVVTITREEHDRTMAISVSNKAVAPPDPLQMLRAGFTTKGGHDGLGLSIVQNLISTIPGGKITPEVSDSNVRFVLSLPVEGSHDS